MISSRFVQEQSWWIASALCQRHHDKRIYLHYPYQGRYDALLVYDSADPEHGSFAELNRNGSIHVDGMPGRRVIGWDEVMSSPGAMDIVKLIEKEWNASPTPARPLPPHSLTYSTISQLLTSAVNRSHPWNVVMGFVDTSGYGWEPDYYVALNGFPQRGDIRAQLQQQSYRFHPMEHAWIFNDGQGDEARPFLILTDDAQAHFPSGESHDLATLQATEGLAGMAATLMRNAARETHP